MLILIQYFCIAAYSNPHLHTLSFKYLNTLNTLSAEELVVFKAYNVGP